MFVFAIAKNEIGYFLWKNNHGYTLYNIPVIHVHFTVSDTENEHEISIAKINNNWYKQDTFPIFFVNLI